MRLRFASALCAAAILWTKVALAASLTLYTSQTKEDAAETAAVPQ